MLFFLFLHTDAESCTPKSPEDMQQQMAAYDALHAEMEAEGVFVATHGLQPPSASTCVTMRDGEPITSDGPFAETKEHIGGFYALELPDMDAAIAWAKRIPAAASGTLEIRPEMHGMRKQD
ncbi:MAG: YciI family protein [Planctomycetota bacterium]